MKYIIPVSIIFLLLIVVSGAGYGYYRLSQKLESFEGEITKIEGNIKELREKTDSLQQENKQLKDTVTDLKTRIEQSEISSVENGKNVSGELPSETDGDPVIEKGDDPIDPPVDGNSSWALYLIIAIILIVIITAAAVTLKVRKNPASSVRENKKFICPDCGWEYRTPITECENCKTKF